MASPAPAAEMSVASASFSRKPARGDMPFQASISAYRSYAQAQADGLVGMTKVLAREIRAGELDAAQSVYAPAHRYLARLAPIARSFSDLYRRMEASAGAGTPSDPDVSGFHRIEQGLFSAHSTAGLSVYADRLLADAVELRKRISTLDITPDLLIDGPAAQMDQLAAQTRAGGSERYSRSDLWTIEATVDGTQQIVSLIEPQVRARDPRIAARLATRLVDVSERIARHKDGCGFKTFDELADADKAALGDGMTALAGELANLRPAFAMDLSLADLRKGVALP